MKYILSLDQGTTSSRSLLINSKGKVSASAQQEFKQIYPKAGWVEHDPIEIFNTQIATLEEIVNTEGVKPEHIAAIGITNQRETVVLWDKQTGKPVHNAIVWQDRRTASRCDELKDGGWAAAN